MAWLEAQSSLRGRREVRWYMVCCWSTRNLPVDVVVEIRYEKLGELHLLSSYQLAEPTAPRKSVYGPKISLLYVQTPHGQHRQTISTFLSTLCKSQLRTVWWSPPKIAIYKLLAIYPTTARSLSISIPKKKFYSGMIIPLSSR